MDEVPAAEAQALVQRVLTDGALVPPLWDLEVGNALLMAERRGRLTPAQTTEAMGLLAGLPIELTESDPAMSELVACARQYGLSTYDAAYLLVAMSTGFPLATQNAGLRRAAETAGVVLG